MSETKAQDEVRSESQRKGENDKITEIRGEMESEGGGPQLRGEKGRERKLEKRKSEGAKKEGVGSANDADSMERETEAAFFFNVIRRLPKAPFPFSSPFITYSLPFLLLPLLSL